MIAKVEEIIREIKDYPLVFRKTVFSFHADASFIDKTFGDDPRRSGDDVLHVSTIPEAQKLLAEYQWIRVLCKIRCENRCTIFVYQDGSIQCRYFWGTMDSDVMHEYLKMKTPIVIKAGSFKDKSYDEDDITWREIAGKCFASFMDYEFIGFQKYRSIGAHDGYPGRKTRDRDYGDHKIGWVVMNFRHKAGIICIRIDLIGSLIDYSYTILNSVNVNAFLGDCKNSGVVV